LNDEEQRIFQSEMRQLTPAEKEKVMEVTNFWEERGRQEGLQQGTQRGMLSLIRRQIEHKFGTVDADVTERIGDLNTDQPETLGDVLLEFSNPQDLAEWLRLL
jgi:hypothetical protein